MRKILWTIVAVVALFVVYRVLVGIGGGVQRPQNESLPVTIVMNGNSCTVNPPKPTIDQGEEIQWSGPPGFVITFANPVFLSTGSPFPNPVGGWQMSFSSGDSLTTPATLTSPEKIIPFLNWFPIQSVTVNGQTCYNRDNGVDPNMKVIVNQ